MATLNTARDGSLLDFIDDHLPTELSQMRVDEYETLLTDNRIWKQRTVNIAVVSPERALQLGFSPARCCVVPGVEWDLRKTAAVRSCTADLDFDIPVGLERRLLR